MGWWPFSSSSDSRADSIRAGTAIPTRHERKLCWAARDAYFACLDAHSILDANKDPAAARAACPQPSADFERDCAAAWVDYFKKWRVADAQKRQRLEELRRQGAVEMEVTAGFATDEQQQQRGGGAKGKEDIQDLLDRKRGASRTN
ncbi:Cytochrome c oxidase subunit 6B-like protein new16 [Escovopsis weberi]|uniref:Cytochrome c oxidase subunit 6B-like protein new16 n=1 Tax=Escovopsis weberi TaxID=150374 RepID=A0A0M8N0T2_ESCWE|nr:Cytochrome c oxidase subunit 6B-like protein new16 [Escovopsis weberi]